MNAWPLPGNRDPRWRMLGWVCIAAGLGFTGLFMLQGPKRLKGLTGTGLFDPGMAGTRGTLTEALSGGRMTLNYRTLEGTEQDMRLKGVTGQLLDSTGLWHLKAPAAQRLDQAWTLNGPLDLDLVDGQGKELGSGRMEGMARRCSGRTASGPVFSPSSGRAARVRAAVTGISPRSGRDSPMAVSSSRKGCPLDRRRTGRVEGHGGRAALGHAGI